MELPAFSGAVAIVTGGASGIGLGLAAEFRKRGATVITADRQQADVVCDVRDPGAVQELVESVARKHGRLDWLFNNAGIFVEAPAIEHTLDDWNHCLDVNLRGVIHGCHAALPIMKRQGSGHIINTASTAGLVASPMSVAFNTSHHALIGLTLSLRLEAALFGVGVTALCPGYVRTPMIIGGVYGRTVFDPEAARARAELFRPQTVERYLQRALPRILRGDAIVVEPFEHRFFTWLMHTFPTLFSRRKSDDFQERLSRRTARPTQEAPRP
jgi:NAD(P)-dependent dehydrogenase (short-subunit alcohol dehydrogenase family)